MPRWIWFFCLAIALGSSAASAQTTRISSWNIHSKQFIDAPTFRLLPIEGTKTYRANIAQGEHKWQVESDRPDVDLSKIWKQLATKKFSLGFEWLDSDDKVIATEPATDRVKAPDFAGFKEPPADWRAAADHGTAFLLTTAATGKAPYREDGVPIWIWSAASPYKDVPDGLDVSYPCITVPNIIWGMIAHVRAHGPQSDEAMRVAQATADWSLQHRLPANAATPLFQYSTVSHGKFGGGIEGENVNLLRASWYALGLVDLYNANGKKDQKYLDYAKQIATTTLKFQALDGSFPYRVNGKTGAVAEAYTPGVAEFAMLVDAMEPYGVTDAMLVARERAIRWVLAYVVTTHHWQAIFEDVSQPVPFANLSQMEAQALIRWLCKHKDEDPTYLPTAEKLNRWIEDQFVIFTGSDAFDRPVKGPLVCEQFICWFPMEGHTAFWIASLLDLHKATGKQEYLDKAMAAGNAIVAQQFDDGSFSTWGVRVIGPEGKIVGDNTGGNWYNANVMAVEALYRLDGYCRATTRP